MLLVRIGSKPPGGSLRFAKVKIPPRRSSGSLNFFWKTCWECCLELEGVVVWAIVGEVTGRDAVLMEVGSDECSSRGIRVEEQVRVLRADNTHARRTGAK